MSMQFPFSVSFYRGNIILGCQQTSRGELIFAAYQVKPLGKCNMSDSRTHFLQHTGFFRYFYKANLRRTICFDTGTKCQLSNRSYATQPCAITSFMGWKWFRISTPSVSAFDCCVQNTISWFSLICLLSFWRKMGDYLVCIDRRRAGTCWSTDKDLPRTATWRREPRTSVRPDTASAPTAKREKNCLKFP